MKNIVFTKCELNKRTNKKFDLNLKKGTRLEVVGESDVNNTLKVMLEGDYLCKVPLGTFEVSAEEVMI